MEKENNNGWGEMPSKEKTTDVNKTTSDKNRKDKKSENQSGGKYGVGEAIFDAALFVPLIVADGVTAVAKATCEVVKAAAECVGDVLS